MAVNLWVPFTVSLDASGNGTQEVGAPAVGYNWQGYITFGQAPSGQSFTVSVSGQVVAYGNRQSGAFAAGSGQMVTVTVSGGPAGTTVNGVVQGVINQGVAAQAALPASGSLIEVSGGTVNIEGGKITIEAGQNGVNVSTDTPPVEGPPMSFAAVGDTEAQMTVVPPSDVSGWSFTVGNGDIAAVSNATSYSVVISDVHSGRVLAQANDVPAASGLLLQGSTNAPMLLSPSSPGLTATVTLTGGSATAAAAVFALWGYYLGTTVTGVTNSPEQPLYAVGTQGQTGASVQTVPEVHYSTDGLPAPGTVYNLPASTNTYVGNGNTGLAIPVKAWLRVHCPSGAITTSWEAGITNQALADASGTVYYPGIANQAPIEVANSGQDAMFGPFALTNAPTTDIAWTLNPGTVAFDAALDLYMGWE